MGPRFVNLIISGIDVFFLAELPKDVWSVVCVFIVWAIWPACYLNERFILILLNRAHHPLFRIPFVFRIRCALAVEKLFTLKHMYFQWIDPMAMCTLRMSTVHSSLPHC